MTSSPSRSTRILTGLATLLLVLSAFFGLFLLGGAAFGYGPSGREVAVHTPVDIDRLQGLPRNTVGPDHLDATVRVRHAQRSSADGRRCATFRSG